MSKRRSDALTMIGLVALLFWAAPAWAQNSSPLKVGDEAPTFQLPCTQDRLVDYYRDYYGKHHLILTFFPAAFTPV